MGAVTPGAVTPAKLAEQRPTTNQGPSLASIDHPLTQAVLTSELASQLNTNILLFRKKPQCLKTTFSTHTAVFYTAEWSSEVAKEPAVYPDDSGFERGRNAVSPGEVFGP